MGVFSQLHADTHDQLEQIRILKNELRIAVRRLETAAIMMDSPSRTNMLRKWASEARAALAPESDK